MVDGYEELRRVALGTAAPNNQRGLALLLHNGVTAWMQAWTEWTPLRPTPAQPDMAPAPPTRPIAPPEMVSVLTELAISAASETPS